MCIFCKNKLLTGDELLNRAQELGVSLHGMGTANSNADDEPELQRRVIEAERSLRESKLWMVAVISAIIALVSAVAAWYSASSCPK